jgi:hypothetical protein
MPVTLNKTTGQVVVAGITTTALATSGTLAFTVPNIGRFKYSGNYQMTWNGNVAVWPKDFTIAFTANTATITWRASNTIAAGTVVNLGLGVEGFDAVMNQPSGAQIINLGSPIAAAATGVTTAQLLGAAGNLTLDGARVTNGVAVLDVPRNFTLTVATTNQSAITFTVYGTDAYGNNMVESLAGPNNNTVAGKKAFKTITRVAASAAVATNGVSVGFGDVLGLPVFLPAAGFILKELEDGAAAVAGTTVAGSLVAPSATSADVRGTYDPNSACDGAKTFELVVALPDAQNLGGPQFV